MAEPAFDHAAFIRAFGAQHRAVVAGHVRIPGGPLRSVAAPSLATEASRVQVVDDERVRVTSDPGGSQVAVTVGWVRLLADLHAAPERPRSALVWMAGRDAMAQLLHEEARLTRPPSADLAANGYAFHARPGIAMIDHGVAEAYVQTHLDDVLRAGALDPQVVEGLTGVRSPVAYPAATAAVLAHLHRTGERHHDSASQLRELVGRSCVDQPQLMADLALSHTQLAGLDDDSREWVRGTAAELVTCEFDGLAGDGGTRPDAAALAELGDEAGQRSARACRDLMQRETRLAKQVTGIDERLGRAMRDVGEAEDTMAAEREHPRTYRPSTSFGFALKAYGEAELAAADGRETWSTQRVDSMRDISRGLRAHYREQLARVTRQPDSPGRDLQRATFENLHIRELLHRTRIGDVRRALKGSVEELRTSGRAHVHDGDQLFRGRTEDVPADLRQRGREHSDVAYRLRLPDAARTVPDGQLVRTFEPAPQRMPAPWAFRSLDPGLDRGVVLDPRESGRGADAGKADSPGSAAGGGGVQDPAGVAQVALSGSAPSGHATRRPTTPGKSGQDRPGARPASTRPDGPETARS